MHGDCDWRWVDLCLFRPVDRVGRDPSADGWSAILIAAVVVPQASGLPCLSYREGTLDPTSSLVLSTLSTFQISNIVFALTTLPSPHHPKFEIRAPRLKLLLLPSLRVYTSERGNSNLLVTLKTYAHRPSSYVELYTYVPCVLLL